jgi:Ca2+-binding EF-hand superfamily protein
MFKYATIALLGAQAAVLKQKDSNTNNMMLRKDDCQGGATIDEVKALYKYLDADADSKLTFNEVLTAVNKWNKENTGNTLGNGDKAALQSLFDEIDGDGTKEISESEWKNAIDGAFATIDANGDGKVNFCEVKNAFHAY